MRIQDIYFIGHLCWCLCNCVTTVYIPCVCRWLCSSEEGVKSPGAVGPGNCESPNMGAESWTWVLLKSSKYPWPVSKFSSFNFWFFSYINAWHDTKIQSFTYHKGSSINETCSSKIKISLHSRSYKQCIAKLLKSTICEKLLIITVASFLQPFNSLALISSVWENQIIQHNRIMLKNSQQA